MGKLYKLRVRSNDLVERRIGPCDREGLGLGRRAVTAHLRTDRSALRLCVRSRDADDGDREDIGTKKLVHCGISFNGGVSRTAPRLHAS
jgi:hypothetical protein